MNFFIKRSSSSDNLLLFLVSAAFSVLGIRIFLETFNYPEIARGQIHLAHALTGAFLLSIANIVLLTYHGKKARQFGAIVGGLGFGQMVDEVGKFITKDNNYFYQPVAMIIYVVFILLFFGYRYLDRYTPRKPKEIIYDTLEHLEELAENNLHEATRRWIEKALHTVLYSTHNYKIFAEDTLGTLQKIIIQPRKENGYLLRIQSSWKWLDDFTAERRPVFYFLLWVFLIYIATTLFTTVTFVQTIWQRQFENLKYTVEGRFELGLIIAQFISQFFSALLMIRGFWYLVHRKKLKALEFFRNGLAVNILITHVFTFYFQQFAAVPELFIMILLFAVVHNILDEER